MAWEKCCSPLLMRALKIASFSTSADQPGGVVKIEWVVGHPEFIDGIVSSTDPMMKERKDTGFLLVSKNSLDVIGFECILFFGSFNCLQFQSVLQSLADRALM